METWLKPKKCAVCSNENLIKKEIKFDEDLGEIKSFKLVCNNCGNSVADFNTTTMTYQLT